MLKPRDAPERCAQGAENRRGETLTLMLIEVAELCEELGISRQTLYRPDGEKLLRAKNA